MNIQEKAFEKTLIFYQEKNRFLDRDFYWFRPEEMGRFARFEKPCDFWFFDRSFTTLELKYTKKDRIQKSQLKKHQRKSLSHFAKNRCKSYVIMSMGFENKVSFLNKAKTYAIPISSYNNWCDNNRKSFIVDEEWKWGGYVLEYLNPLKIFNIDKLVNCKYRIF